MTEDGLVEATPCLVARPLIEHMRVLEQPQAEIEVLLGARQVVDDPGELFIESGSLTLDVAEPLLNLVLGEGAGSGRGRADGSAARLGDSFGHAGWAGDRGEQGHVARRWRVCPRFLGQLTGEPM
ncbi:hypothetical protein ACXPWS_08055 [Mycobacterium sp. BMJ-28]